MRAGWATLVLALAASPATADSEDDREVPERIDAARSQVAFGVRLRWLQKIEGRFGGFDGRIGRLADGRRRVEVEVDVGSLDMGDRERITDWALSEDFFDVARYPVIVFVSEPFDAALARDGGELHGELSLRGVTRRVAFRLLPATCRSPGLACAIHVQGQVRRSDFGMDANRLAVQDRVKLDFVVRLDGASR